MNSNKELPGPTLMGAGVGAHAGRRVPQDQPHTGRHRCCPGAVAALIIFVSQGILGFLQWSQHRWNEGVGGEVLKPHGG